MTKKQLDLGEESLRSRSPVPFRTRFTAIYDSVRPTVRCLDTPEDRRTKSEFAQDCDINRIVARYKKTGVLPESARAAALRYGDFSQIPDFREMQEKIIAAHEVFAALPAEVRKQFDNDPGAFIDASQTREGRELMVKLGLGAEKPADGVSDAPGGSPKASSASAGQAVPSSQKKVVKGDEPAKTDQSSQD